MNFPLYIAKRYLFTKSSNNAINIITIIAAIGVFAGAFSLFIVLSGFSGLRDFSLSFTNEFDPDLKIFPKTGKTIQLSDAQLQKLNALKDVSAYSKVIEERVILSYKSKSNPASIKGVDENYRRVNNIDSSLVYGSWFAKNENQVVVGNGISRLLSLGTFNYQNFLQIRVPKPGKGQVTNPVDAFSSKKVIVSDIYSINEDLDDKFVFSSLGLARDLLNYQRNEVSAVEFILAPETEPQKVAGEIAKIFNNQVEIKTRAQLNEVLYKMLNTENLAVYLIFTLVLIIALFNVVGSIIMVILDKRENINTLHSLGANPSQIRNIFFYQGLLMTVIGGLLGLICSVILIFLQLKFDLVMITPSLPYPVALRIENMLIVMGTIGVLGFLASYIAAGRSKKALQV